MTERAWMRRARALLVAALCFTCRPIVAKEYFVDRENASANDQNPGTEALPFQTIQSAVNLANAGDVIWIKKGLYDEKVEVKSQGTRALPITIAAWKDDRVRMGSEPRALPGPEAWQKIEGTKSWRITMPEGTPGDIIVLFDGKAQPCQTLDTPPKDDQVLWSTYREKDRTLMVNAGGPNPAERHKLLAARNLTGSFILHLDSANWIVRGLEFGYAKEFIVNFGYHNIIEDCYFHNAYRRAVFGKGYLGTVRRCTFDDSALHGSGPGAASLFEDNIFYRGKRNWDEDIDSRVMDYHEGSGGIMFKGGGYGITLRHNFCDDVGFWSDGNGTGVRLYGNAFHTYTGYAIYNEYANDDTLVIGNYMGNTQAGVASSYCSRLNVIDNFIEGPGNGIILHNRDKWPLRYSFMVIRGNAIVGSPVPLSGYGANYETFSEGWSNCLVDFNRYRMKRDGGILLDLNGKDRCKTIDEMRERFGWDLHGDAKPYDPENNDLTPESLGAGTVTVRTPVGQNGWMSRPFLSDPEINGKWPAVPRFLGGTLPPFFWRIADGNYNDNILSRLSERRFDEKWWPGCGAGYGEGEVKGCAWYVGADPIPGMPDLAWSSLVDQSEGNRFLVMAGKTPDKMLAQGVGYWSPSLPTCPGAVINVSLTLKGIQLEAFGENGGPAIWLQFTSLTGQVKTRVFLLGRNDEGSIANESLMSGTYDWTAIKETIRAPESAGRMALFFGLRPTKGKLYFDSINIKTQPGEMPESAKARDALPPRVPLERFRDVFYIDLSPFVNRSFADDEANNGIGGWSDQGPNCDMREVKTGLRKFGGVPFNILPDKSLIVLKSPRRNPGNLPDKVDIPVGRKVDTLFFLHSSAWGSAFGYILHYADGNDVTITMDSKNMKGWVGEPVDYFPAEETTYTTVAETVPTPQFGKGSLYRTEWSAPADRRAIELKSIEFVNSGGCVPILAGITGILEW